MKRCTIVFQCIWLVIVILILMIIPLFIAKHLVMIYKSMEYSFNRLSFLPMFSLGF